MKLNKVKIRIIEYGIVFFVILVLIYFLFPPGFVDPKERSMVSRVKAEQQTIAMALETYFIDHKSYPLPDFDAEGKAIVPQILTSPTAYLLKLLNDPFKNKGKGYYEYGINTTKGWIITSYGPDYKDGNTKIKNGSILDESKACSDESLGFSLIGSGLTYDPTNGTKSPGDIWRRGP